MFRQMTVSAANSVKSIARGNNNYGSWLDALGQPQHIPQPFQIVHELIRF
jgi:Tfp pilus assembly protein PilF